MRSKYQVQSPSSINPSLNVKSLTSPTHKKVEGFDKTVPSQMFSSKVNKLKNRPKAEGLEEQYINGLQDQIKYLELQIKLLQEKDQERHGQIDQLEKFFADGVPINENILAIKNGFNNYKNCNQKKLKELSGEKAERGTLINQLDSKVGQLLDQLNTNEKENKQAEEKNQQRMFQLIYKDAALKKTLEKEEEQLKAVKLDVRKTSQALEKLTRNKLINNITGLNHENHKFNKLNNLRQTLQETEKELSELEIEHQKLHKSQEQKSFLIALEEQNLGQRKKVIALERDYDNLKIKNKEKNMELQQKLKERMVEINYNNDIKQKVQALKQQINKENGLTVEAVTQLTREREIQKLKKIVDSNQVLSKHIDHYSSILSSLQNHIQNLAQRKPDAKSQLQHLHNELLKLQKRYRNQKEREVALHAELVQIQEQSNEIKVKVTPIQEKSRKKNDLIQVYLQERKRILEEIKIKQKQLELIFILKGLNFEEAQISKNSNSSIQQELTSFLKNWQKLQRTP